MKLHERAQEIADKAPAGPGRLDIRAAALAHLEAVERATALQLTRNKMVRLTGEQGVMVFDPKRFINARPGTRWVGPAVAHSAESKGFTTSVLLDGGGGQMLVSESPEEVAQRVEAARNE